MQDVAQNYPLFKLCTGAVILHNKMCLHMDTSTKSQRFILNIVTVLYVHDHLAAHVLCVYL
jgi:hypothetical protein